MFTLIKSNMQRDLGERDGTALPEILDVLATSAIDTLSNPSDDVIRAEAEALYHAAGVVVAYEHVEATFKAMIEWARRD